MLPVLPTSFSVGQVFPYVEGQQFEFKATHISCDTRKLYETMCAFLNAAGGYIVVGVSDKGIVKGITREGVDTLLLHVDNLYHSKVLFHARTQALMDVGTICAKSVPLKGAENQYLVIITVCNTDPENVYKLSGGEVFIRLNASNYRAQAGRRMDVDRLQSELSRSVAECHTMRRTLAAVQRSNAELVATIKDCVQTTQTAQQSMLEVQELLFARILAEKAAVERALQPGGGSKGCWAACATALAGVLCGLKSSHVG